MRSRPFVILALSSLIFSAALVTLGIVSYSIRIPLLNLRIGGGHQTLALTQGWFRYAASNKIRQANHVFLVRDTSDGLPFTSIFRSTEKTDPSHTVFSINTMVWPYALLAAIPAAAWVVGHFVHRRRIGMRTGRKLCVACGYDLRASKTRCPECGTAIHAAESGGP